MELSPFELINLLQEAQIIGQIHKVVHQKHFIYLRYE